MTETGYQWGIFLASLDPTLDSEQRGRRPVLVMSDENFNRVMPVVTILPLTSLKRGRKVYSNEVLLKKGQAGLSRDSLVLTHQIRTIAKTRLQRMIGFITDEKIRQAVRETLRIHLSLYQLPVNIGEREWPVAVQVRAGD